MFPTCVFSFGRRGNTKQPSGELLDLHFLFPASPDCTGTMLSVLISTSSCCHPNPGCDSLLQRRVNLPPPCPYTFPSVSPHPPLPMDLFWQQAAQQTFFNFFFFLDPCLTSGTSLGSHREQLHEGFSSKMSPKELPCLQTVGRYSHCRAGAVSTALFQRGICRQSCPSSWDVSWPGRAGIDAPPLELPWIQ